MWKRIVIEEHQRGLRVVDGKVVAWLGPGAHRVWFPGPGRRIEVVDLDAGVTPARPEVERVVPAGAAEVLDVPFGEQAGIWVDGLPARVVGPGRYLLWQGRHTVTALRYVDARHTALPRALWRLAEAVRVVVVQPHEAGVVVEDGVVVETLPPGVHGLQARDRELTLHTVDLRETLHVLTGQELLTADKVSLRMSLLVRSRVEDPVLAVTAVRDVQAALHAEVQLATRRVIGASSFDEALDGRRAVGRRLVEEVAPAAAAWGLELRGVDLRDLVLPAEMKGILNQVIQAEKHAAAHAILRREETAATRSLANTARLLESNPTLMRLKELEALQQVAGQVGTMNVVTGSRGLLELLGPTAG